MRYTRRTLPATPTEASLRARAVDELEAEVLARDLRGNELRCYVFTVRARAGAEVALSLALRLADRR